MTALRFSIFLLLGLAPLHSAWAECSCIYTGGTVKEGQTACIWTADGNRLARCEKVLNNTSWKLLGGPCPSEQSSVREFPPKNAKKPEADIKNILRMPRRILLSIAS